MAQCWCIQAVGWAATTLIAAKIAHMLYRIIYPYFLAKKITDFVAYSGGKWAVVTGSTDGIGKGYAFELARRGMNIVLVARSESKLKDVQKEILAKHTNVEVRYAVLDFTTANVDDYKHAYNSAGLDKLDIGVLVNNVGLSTEYPDYFLGQSMDTSRNVLIVNTMGTMAFTHLILPQMLARQHGVIVNVSSSSDMAATPLLGVYAASKSFVKRFTAALQNEYAGKGVTIQCISPFFVATKMARVRPSFTAPDPVYFARSALDTVGVLSSCYGYWVHELQGQLAGVMPDWVLAIVMRKLLGPVRAKALKRQAAKKE